MQDMKITYIGHSGFAVRWDGHAAVFDYFQGEVPEFEKDTKIYVFASHAHYDHFSRVFSNGRQNILISPTFYPAISNTGFRKRFQQSRCII